MEIVVKGSNNFMVTQQMLQVDEEIAQKLVGDIDQLELVMAQIPTKALYGLQASIMQEVQSRAHTDATNLEVGREVTKMLQITCDQLTLEKEEEKKRADRLEKGLTIVYNNIPDCTQEPEDTPEGKFQNIVQVMEQYKKDITELMEKLTPSTPLEVREKREHEATVHIDSIAGSQGSARTV
jgi:hypothetical protein